MGDSKGIFIRFTEQQRRLVASALGCPWDQAVQLLVEIVQDGLDAVMADITGGLGGEVLSLSELAAPAGSEPVIEC